MPIGKVDTVPKNACTLKVPIGSVSAYQNADVWKEFYIEGIVGVETIEPAVVKIYPNPTTGELRIKNFELGIRGIELFDVYGRKHEGTKGKWCWIFRTWRRGYI